MGIQFLVSQRNSVIQVEISSLSLGTLFNNKGVDSVGVEESDEWLEIVSSSSYLRCWLIFFFFFYSLVYEREERERKKNLRQMTQELIMCTFSLGRDSVRNGTFYIKNETITKKVREDKGFLLDETIAFFFRDITN